MPESFNGYRLVNILSLDVVAGSMVSAAFFSKVFAVRLHVLALLALGLTVWIIYTIDHLRDAYSITHPASTERHRFHQIHHQGIRIALITVGLLNGALILQLPRQILLYGVVLGLPTMLLLVLQRFLPWIKELLISVFYTCGVLLPSLPFVPDRLGMPDYMIAFQFSITALMNLLVFSWYDRNNDRKDNLPSLVTVSGAVFTRIMLYTCWVFSAGISVYQFASSGNTIASMIILCGASVMLLLFQFEDRFSKNNRYRYIGDLIFLIPLLYLL
jgi:hypothetical protein